MKNSSLMAHRPVTETASSKGRGRRRLRNAAVVLGLSGALVGGVAGVAQASQVATLSPNQTQSFSTWFWGRTEVCFQNVSPQYDASYYWHSGPSASGGGGLTPGQQSCLVLSFVGFNINVSNLSARAPIQVTFPIGP
jgi:hypothetical protein